MNVLARHEPFERSLSRDFADEQVQRLPFFRRAEYRPSIRCHTGDVAPASSVRWDHHPDLMSYVREV